MTDYRTKKRKKKLNRMMKKFAKEKLRTWWGTLAIMFFFVTIFSTAAGIYLLTEKIYKQPETAMRMYSYLQFSEMNLINN